MSHEELIDKVREKIIKYYSGDPKRIQHFLKVHYLASLIGKKEGLDEHTLFILELAALLHDIGIKVCEELYGSTSGKLQEFEGPTLAGELLEEIGVDADVIDRVCFLISKHHTYTDVEGMDWRILLEADYLVNAFEEGYSKEGIERGKEKVFETETGKNLLKNIYG